MSKKIWKLYDIKYYGSNKSLPKELVLDLNSYEWAKNIPVGPFHLNTKAFRAIKQETGYEAKSCKVDMVKA